MTNKVEYLEKYTVAPSPSRDYYGIKVLRDEIIFFLWKISHGPHRSPIIRVSKFSEFETDKFLQEEIQRIFGEYVFEHVRNIAFGHKLSILTLPKNVIARISKYLTIRDIINLSKLSHISKEIFDNDIVWEVLYEKYKGSKIIKKEKELAMTSSWKELVKDKKLNELIKNRKFIVNKQRARESSASAKTPAIKSNVGTSNQLKTSSNTFSRKNKEVVNRFANSTILQKESFPGLNLSKKENAVKSKSIITKSDAAKNKLLQANQLKIDTKVNQPKLNQSVVNKNIIQKTNPRSIIVRKPTENLISRASLLSMKSKSSQNKFVKNEDSELKTQKKMVDGKSRKMNTKLETINGRNVFQYNEDISFLIEEELQKMKNPRSIFNYDFSILNDEKSSGDSKSLSPRPDSTKSVKDFSHGNGIANFLAKSEGQSDDDGKSEIENLTQKYLNARAKFIKSTTNVTNISAVKIASISNLSFNGKNRKSAILTNLKRTEGSTFAAKDKDSKNIVEKK